MYNFFFYLLLIISVAALIFICVYLGHYIRQHKEIVTCYKKPLIYSIVAGVIGTITLLVAMLIAYPRAGFTDIKWYHYLATIVGSIVTGASFFGFWICFIMHYYGKFLSEKARKWYYWGMIISLCAFIVFIFVLSEGFADYLTYPLVNGISFSGGLHWTTPRQSNSIAFYAIFILFGAIVVYLMCDHKLYVQYGKHGMVDGTFIFGLVTGIIGARLFYVIGNWQEYKGTGFGNMIAMWNGGLTVLGGVFTGVVCGIIWLLVRYRKDNYSIFVMVDIIIPTILIAQALGRWGNFFNVEVYGNAVNSAWYAWLPSIITNNLAAGGQEGMIYAPLFLIECVANVGGYFIITKLFGKKLRKYLEDGDQGAMYFVWYGLVRLIMEPFRYSNFNMGSDGYWSIIWSVAFVLVGMLVILVNHVVRFILKRKKGTLRYTKDTYHKSFIGTIVFSALAVVFITTGSVLLGIYPLSESLSGFTTSSLGMVFLSVGLSLAMIDAIVIITLISSYPTKDTITSVCKYDLFVFDLDGTLATTDELVRLSYMHLYDLHKNSIYPTDQTLYEFSGPQLRDVIKEEFPNEDTEKLAQEFYDYSAKLYDDVKPYQNEVKMLEYLRNKGVKVAIFTNKKHDLTIRCLNGCGITEYIDMIVGYEDCEPRKPLPDGIYKIMETYGITDRNRVLYLGDSPVDALVAKNAGVDFCHINWGPRHYDENLALPYTITNYKEIKDLF
ncbi:MAG: prolipoprotein diacylglyceryl transferase [Coprobacillus sp.]|nr:prolipoprotein diacylglyceryl transferase [Coprobacillus sp.]